VAPIFGPHDPILIPAIHACIAARSTPFILGTGTNLNDYIYVSNAADAHVLAVANLLTSQTAAGEAFFISNGTPVPLRDLCCAVWKEFGHVPPFEVHVPEALARWVACVTEGVAWLVGADAPFSRGLVSDACRVHYVDIRKARAVLGYRPRIPLDEGVRLSCQVCPYPCLFPRVGSG
jgi:sterol-4alpha-carboxylate 3-dehydrogenase (decarboxylating)